jgi:hypothetical protein
VGASTPTTSGRPTISSAWRYDPPPATSRVRRAVASRSDQYPLYA